MADDLYRINFDDDHDEYAALLPATSHLLKLDSEGCRIIKKFAVSWVAWEKFGVGATSDFCALIEAILSNPVVAEQSCRWQSPAALSSDLGSRGRARRAAVQAPRPAATTHGASCALGAAREA